MKQTTSSTKNHSNGKKASSTWERCIVGNRLRILAYHSISEKGADEMTLTPQTFERQMRWLRESEFAVISLEEALVEMAARRDLTRRVVLTFDDGYADFVERAVPIMEKYQFKATVFVVTGRIGQTSDWNRISQPRPTLSLAALRDLRCLGYTVGSHSVTHRRFSQLPEEDVELELKRSKVFLEDQLNTQPVYLAYPYGDFGPRERAAAVKAGYTCACGVGGRWGNSYQTDRFRLHRYLVLRKHSFRDFRRWLHSPLGWPFFALPWQRSSRAKRRNRSAWVPAGR